MGNITYTMIKPDISGNEEAVDDIRKTILRNGFEIRRVLNKTLSKELAEEFYSEHSDKPFFPGLVEFMTSGNIIAMELEKDNAVRDFRILIGATNPSEANEGTIRKKWATSMGENAIHGSDSDESAQREINTIFGFDE